jgi:hypothetical protein
MSRPAGVLIAAVLLGIIALFGILCTATGLVLAIFTHNPILPNAFRPYAVFSNAIGLGFFLWCAWTVIDLFRMRVWARISAAVIGVLVAVFAALAGGGLLAARRYASSLPAGPSNVHLSSLLVYVAVFYLVVAALGLWWAIYFNLSHVRAAFGAATLMVTNPEILPPGAGSDTRL